MRARRNGRKSLHATAPGWPRVLRRDGGQRNWICGSREGQYPRGLPIWGIPEHGFWGSRRPRRVASSAREMAEEPGNGRRLDGNPEARLVPHDAIDTVQASTPRSTTQNGVPAERASHWIAFLFATFCFRRARIYDGPGGQPAHDAGMAARCRGPAASASARHRRRRCRPMPLNTPRGSAPVLPTILGRGAGVRSRLAIEEDGLTLGSRPRGGGGVGGRGVPSGHGYIPDRFAATRAEGRGLAMSKISAAEAQSFGANLRKPLRHRGRTSAFRRSLSKKRLWP